MLKGKQTKQNARSFTLCFRSLDRRRRRQTVLCARQVLEASHLPHEGNSEQLFSRTGALSDNNGKMDPTRLAVWTSIGVNYKLLSP